MFGILDDLNHRKLPVPRVKLTTGYWTAILACVPILIYMHTLGHGFVFDDLPEITQNSYVRSVSYLWSVFTSPVWAGAGLKSHLYRPLTTATYTINYFFAGLVPWSYHATNIALHALVTVLFFRLALHWRFTLQNAGYGALLFAIHPIHVEAVANVAGRKELLVAIFVLVALLAHARALRRGRFWTVAAPVAFGAALFSKETGAVTLGLFILQDALLEPRVSQKADRRRRLLLYGIYGLILLLYLFVRWSVVGPFGIPNISIIDNPTANASTWVRAMTATAVVGRGLALLVAPLNLSPDYSYQAIPVVENPLDAGFLLTVLVIVGLAAVAWALRRTQPLVPFALGWYALTLSPAANLIFPVGTIFGERLLYLPSLAFCLLAGHLLAKGASKLRPVMAAFLAACLVTVLGVRTATYAAVWSDSLTLFTAAAQSVPNSTKVYLNLGIALMAQGRPEEAITAHRRALAIYPDNHEAAVQLGGIHERLGRLELADKIYQRVLTKRPNEVRVLHALGAIRRNQGNLSEAADFWSRAIAVDPNHDASLSDLGNVRFITGDLAGAQYFYERAVTANPDSSGTWYNLGLLYAQTGDWRRTRAAWRRFLETAGEDQSERIEEVRQKLGTIP